MSFRVIFKIWCSFTRLQANEKEEIANGWAYWANDTTADSDWDKCDLDNLDFWRPFVDFLKKTVMTNEFVDQELIVDQFDRRFWVIRGQSAVNSKKWIWTARRWRSHAKLFYQKKSFLFDVIDEIEDRRDWLHWIEYFLCIFVMPIGSHNVGVELIVGIISWL